MSSLHFPRHEYFMRLALREAERSARHGDVPVGCVIVLDGEPLGGELLTYRFEHTGGFGAKPEEWRQMMVVGADGAPAVLDLTAGPHTLTMTCLANRLNLDYLALIPVE